MLGQLTEPVTASIIAAPATELFIVERDSICTDAPLCSLQPLIAAGARTFIDELVPVKCNLAAQTSLTYPTLSREA
jgi:hypothetical protein